MNMQNQKTLIIAGCTASGKSQFALDLAKKRGGVIINADSMQVYEDLPILTAQPSRQEQQVVPHRLYGILEGREVCSAARWAALALEQVEWCRQHDLKPIIVGGTGLYLLVLLKGLSVVPDVDPEIRRVSRDLYEEVGGEEFYQLFADLDPVMASKLIPSDKQRLIRAYEVKLSTGVSLLEWQSNPRLESGLDCEMLVIDRPRDVLHQRAAERFDQMLVDGILDEMDVLLQKGYDEELPVMRAVGVKELSSYIRGDMNMEQARERAVIATRQFIKRQDTFFRNQFPDAERIHLSG
jgi:tRNA dimethylallyltransferase